MLNGCGGGSSTINEDPTNGSEAQMRMEVALSQVMIVYSFHSIIRLLALILPVVVLQIRVSLLRLQETVLLAHVNWAIQPTSFYKVPRLKQN